MSAGDEAWLDAEQGWIRAARPNQVLPISGWALAIAQSGRGFGKTMMGASLVRRWAGMFPGCVIHAIAPSHADLIGTMFNGISGIMSVCPAPMIASVNFSDAIPTIRFYNGSIVRGFSSESPDRLRGPQATFVWGDEIAAWRNAEETLTNIDMSTRIVFRQADGTLVQPQRFYTTTPRPLKWLADLIKRAGKFVIRGSTYDNRANLAESFLKEIEQYEETQIGRQEIHGELIDIGESAIIKRSWLKLWPNAQPLPWFEFVMVSMDTAFTEKAYDKKSFEADPTACGTWGVFMHDKKWNLMLLEFWKDHLGFPALVAAARKEMRAIYGRRREILFKPVVGSRHEFEQIKRPDLLIIEDKGSGISLRQMLAQEGQDSYPYNPGNADKMSRLHSVSHVAAGGRIWLPESSRNPGNPRDWVEPMLDELCVYSGPGTTPHDDVVDMASQAWRVFADRWLSAGLSAKVAPDGLSIIVDPELTGIPGEDRLPGEYHETPSEESAYG